MTLSFKTHHNCRYFPVFLKLTILHNPARMYQFAHLSDSAFPLQLWLVDSVCLAGVCIVAINDDHDDDSVMLVSLQ